VAERGGERSQADRRREGARVEPAQRHGAGGPDGYGRLKSAGDTAGRFQGEARAPYEAGLSVRRSSFSWTAGADKGTGAGLLIVRRHISHRAIEGRDRHREDTQVGGRIQASDAGADLAGPRTRLGRHFVDKRRHKEVDSTRGDQCVRRERVYTGGCRV
jgi:hypothetical protein